MLAVLRRFAPVISTFAAFHSLEQRVKVRQRTCSGWPLVPLGAGCYAAKPLVECALHYRSWSPYARCWHALPSEMKEELEAREIRADPFSADVAVKALVDGDILLSITEACPLHLPEDQRKKAPDYTALLKSLHSAASGSKRARMLSPFELGMAFHEPEDSDAPSHSQRDWSSWRPSAVSPSEPQTQRGQDLAIKLKWSDRILNLVAPYWRSFPSLEDPEGKNKYELWRPLVGKTRGSTLSVLARTLERTCKEFGILWPLTDSRVVNLLRHCQKASVSSQRLSGIWKALNWVGEHFGCLIPKESRDLQNRYEYVRTAMVVVGYSLSRRALPPPMEAVKALEERAVNSPSSVDRYAASFFRWCIGCSARYSDTLHTQPSTFLETKDTVEFTAWQTKSVDAGSVHRPQPLISPLVFFHSKGWWKEICLVTKARLKDAGASKDDYLLPCPNSSRTAFVSRPCSNAKAIRWLRSLLTNSTVHVENDVITKLTVSSFRVFMPNLAQVFLIDKERRQYLGRWTEADTADVYTREHRSVVSGIWHEVAAKLAANEEPSKSSKALEEVPVELAHSHYALDEVVEEEQIPVFPLVTGHHVKLPKKPKVNTLKAPPKRGDGQLFHLVANTKRTGTPRVFRVHWFSDDLKCIGCSFQPARNLVSPFDVQDWDPLNYDFCQKASLICAPPKEFSHQVVSNEKPLQDSDHEEVTDDFESSNEDANA